MADTNEREREGPTYEELRELPELRRSAALLVDHPCFTNAMVEIVHAYQAGFSASQSSTLERVRSMLGRELQIAEQSVHPCSLVGLRSLLAAIDREFGGKG